MPTGLWKELLVLRIYRYNRSSNRLVAPHYGAYIIETILPSWCRNCFEQS